MIFEVLWLAPAYIVTLLVNNTWYQELASLASRIQSEEKRLWISAKMSQEAAAPRTQGTQAAQLSAGRPLQKPLDPLESAAQELSRSLLFIVFYVEVWALGLVPYAGKALVFLMLSWLYAFFCYDYSWSLCGVRLHERLAFVEMYWPFYAGSDDLGLIGDYLGLIGSCLALLVQALMSSATTAYMTNRYGALMSSTTAFLPFYSGAAVLAALFPLFTLVACESNPRDVIARATSRQSAPAAPVGAARGSTGNGNTVLSEGARSDSGRDPASAHASSHAGSMYNVVGGPAIWPKLSRTACHGATRPLHS
eukprot:gene29130-32349_t